VDVNTKIDRFDIDLKLWGDALVEVASALEFFYVGIVTNEIEKQIENALKVTLPSIVDGMIEKSEGVLPIPIVPNWMVNLESETKY